MGSNTEPITWNEENQVKWVGIRPGYHGDQVTAYNSVAAGTAIVYTVPAGKTLLIFNTSMSVSRNAVGVSPAYFILRDSGDVLVHEIYKIYVNGVGSVISVSTARYSPLIAPADYDITIQSGIAADNVAGSFEGILVDA